MGRWKNKRRRLCTYGDGPFTFVSVEVKSSTAYKVLTPTARLVLADMLTIYAKISGWDTDPPHTGFTYTYKECGEPVSENSFYDAIDQICRVGFFSYPPAIQESKPNAPKRYLHGTTWRQYVPSSDEKINLSRYDSYKSDRISRQTKRITEYRKAANRKKGPAKIEGTDPQKLRAANILIYDVALKK